MKPSSDDQSSLTGSRNETRVIAYLANFIENSLDAIVAFNPGGRIVFWNLAAERTFGWMESEALGKRATDLFWPMITAQEQEDQRQRQLRLECGEVVQGEHIMQRKEGPPLWIKYSIHAIMETETQISGFVAVYRDITERKRAEAELRARTEEVEALLQVSPIAFFVAHDAECKRITGNPAGYRLVELPVNDGLNVSKSASEEERPAYRVFRDGVELASEDLPMQVAARLGVEVHEESLELRFEDSSHKYIYAYAKPLLDENGKSRGAIAAMLDITARKQVEEQLERSNQKLNEILASIQDDFYVLDRDWKFVYANRLFTARVGKEPEDFVGNNIWEMFPKHAGGVLFENFHTAMEKRQVRRFEIPGKYTDAWYRMTAFPSEEGITVLGTDITERKKAENALKESQRKYQHLIETTSDFIWEMDAQGKYTYCSPQMEILWGLKPEDMLGKTPFDIMPPEEKEKALETFKEVSNSAAPFTGLTTTAFDRQGHLISIETSGVPFFDQDGRLLGYRGITRDVTERQRMEREIESLAKFPMENPNPVLRIHRDGVISFANAASDRLLQLWNRAVGECLSESEHQLVLQTLESRTVIEQEVDCAGRIYSLILTPIADGGYVNIYGRDITERKQAEKALRETMQNLRAHTDNSPLAVIAFDPEYHIKEWSAGAERMFGWRAEEVLNKTISELRWVHEADAERVARLSADMFAGRVLSNVHANRNYRQDGSIIECEWYNSALLDANSKLISVRSQVLDVTERNQAEKNLRESKEQLKILNESLEQKVNEQTAEVRRLASELTKAEQRERHRIAQILHEDLQQRIYAVKIRLEFLQEGLGTEDHLISQEIASVNKQLAEILAHTRHLSVELSPPILRDEGLTQAFQWLAFQMEKQHGLQIAVRAEESYFISDESLRVMLFTCVRELLFNVVKHAGVNQALVSLRQSNGKLQIEVQDQGKGFDIAVLEKGDRIIKEEGEPRRHSFGLPTLRHQLGLIGGQMEIQSEPDRGTVITITIPYA